MPPRLEDHNQPLSRGAGGLAVSRSPVDLLLLDERDSRCGPGRLRPETPAGDPIPQDLHSGRAAPGFWPAGELDDQPDRSGPVSAPQRHSLPYEQLHELLAFGVVLGEPATD